MSEIINNQKIAKRNRISNSFTNSGSLMTTASNYRSIHQSSRFDILKGRLKRNIKKRSKIKMENPKGQPDNKSADTRQKSNHQRLSIKKQLLIFNNIFKRIKILGIKKTVIYSVGGLAFLIFLGFITNFFIEKHLYNQLTLHQDTPINDVLYESLPADYSGQGSGEIIGIEPVLITAGEPLSYTIRPGDTLSEISHQHNIKISTLISFNKISDVRRLQVGMKLKIPGFDGIPYEVKLGDNIEKIANKYDISVNSILDANDLDTAEISPGENLFIPGAVMNEFDYKKAMGTLFIYPARGRLSSGFGYRPDPFTGRRRFHNGLDLANATGTTVTATMSGIVADTGSQPSGYGNYIIIKHANGYQSLYGHLNRTIVRKGQYVSQGQKLGDMGNTGRSTGPHLHFSIYKSNVPVNPLTYLW